MVRQRWALGSLLPWNLGVLLREQRDWGQMCCLEEDVHFFMFVLLLILVNRA